MTKALYLDDSYLTEFTAVVESVSEDKYIVLDQTLFYPSSGGQPHDIGILTCDGREYPVVFCRKVGDVISHEIAVPGLKVGDCVTGKIDWKRRYTLMRYHTAAHLISGVFNHETKALITGNQLELDKGRIDFNLEEFDREKIADFFNKANELVAKNLTIKAYTYPRDEALKMPDLFKLANVLPPTVTQIRVIDIEGFDRQADGGTHIKSLKEIGTIAFMRADNKGKSNRRIYFNLV